MGAISHYTGDDRAALSRIFELIPYAPPVSCRGSEHDCAPGDWPDHSPAKAPFLHATGKPYRWNDRRMAEVVRTGLGLAFPRSGLFGLDNDGAALGASPLGGGGLVHSRAAHEHFLHRRAPAPGRRLTGRGARGGRRGGVGLMGCRGAAYR